MIDEPVGERPCMGGYNRRGIQNFIDETVLVPLGCTIWHYAVVLEGVTLGVGCSIGSHAEIGFRSVIGAHTRISKGVFLPSDSKIGDRVFIGPNVTFTDDRFPRIPKPNEEKSYDARPPIVEDHASIGAGAVILPGVRIGHHALVGAGAIVTEDVVPYAIVRGEPARWTRSLDEAVA